MENNLYAENSAYMEIMLDDVYEEIKHTNLDKEIKYLNDTIIIEEGTSIFELLNIISNALITINNYTIDDRTLLVLDKITITGYSTHISKYILYILLIEFIIKKLDILELLSDPTWRYLQLG